MSSLASATLSVAYARFARSLTWTWWVRLLQLLRVWLTLASLAHSHGRDEAGRECVITYTKWLRARAAHNMGNLWQCNVHKKPPSIAPSLPLSLPACWPTISTVPTWREGMGLSSYRNILYTKWLRAQAAQNTGNLWQCYNFHTKPPSIPTYLPTVFHTIRGKLSLFDILVFFSKIMYTMDVYGNDQQLLLHTRPFASVTPIARTCNPRRIRSQTNTWPCPLIFTLWPLQVGNQLSDIILPVIRWRNARAPHTHTHTHTLKYWYICSQAPLQEE